jgi:hypothetical protein
LFFYKQLPSLIPCPRSDHLLSLPFPQLPALAAASSRWFATNSHDVLNVVSTHTDFLFYFCSLPPPPENKNKNSN